VKKKKKKEERNKKGKRKIGHGVEYKGRKQKKRIGRLRYGAEKDTESET